MASLMKGSGCGCGAWWSGQVSPCMRTDCSADSCLVTAGHSCGLLSQQLSAHKTPRQAPRQLHTQLGTATSYKYQTLRKFFYTKSFTTTSLFSFRMINEFCCPHHSMSFHFLEKVVTVKAVRVGPRTNSEAGHLILLSINVPK